MVTALRVEASPASFTYSPIHRSVTRMELKEQEACYRMCVCVWGGSHRPPTPGEQEALRP